MATTRADDPGYRPETLGERATGSHDETKCAPLTTEFWAMLVVIIAVLIAAAVSDTFGDPTGVALRRDRGNGLHRQPGSREDRHGQLAGRTTATRLTFPTTRGGTPPSPRRPLSPAALFYGASTCRCIGV